MKKIEYRLPILTLITLLLFGCAQHVNLRSFSDPALQSSSVKNVAIFPIRNTRILPGGIKRNGEIVHTRVRFILYPLVCAYCGELWPDFFKADDWNKYIELDMQDKVLCQKCFDFIKNAIDTKGKIEEVEEKETEETE